MWPDPWASIRFSASWLMWKKLARLVPMFAAQSSGVNWVNGLAVKIPALLTSVSMRPKRSTPSLKIRAAVAGSAASPAIARTPGSLLAAIERELATTRKPARR